MDGEGDEFGAVIFGDAVLFELLELFVVEGGAVGLDCVSKLQPSMEATIKLTQAMEGHDPQRFEWESRRVVCIIFILG